MRSGLRGTWYALFVLLCVIASRRVLAADKSAPKGAPPPAASVAPAASARPAPLPWQPGPTTVTLGHDLTLAVPAEDAFLESKSAAKVLEKMGSFHNDDLLGVVVSKEDSAEWFITIRYAEEGYIKDDEKIDASELLSAIKEGTEEANKERVEKGFKALKIDGWTEPPAYQKAQHHLVWALNVSDEDGKSINYNTRILGRRGYVSINLVTDPPRLAQYKPQAATVLAATTFGPGARYEDFDEKKGDKVAEYGLAGLVLGGAGLAAAKLVKIGLFAKFFKVIIAALIAAKKAIVVALVGIGAAIKKLFTGKKTVAQEAPPPGPPA
jgi:uncharacterized membrane-anchored protein